MLLQSVEDPASLQADRINRLFNHFNLAAAAMLLLVTVLVIYICIRFRHRKGDDTEGSPNTGNRLMESLMIGLPTLLLAWFFYETVSASNAILPGHDASRQPDVIITGHQFWWEITYPGKVITANEVHLPTGRHLLMEMRSADVIHDWWVPQLGNKMDLIPGNDNYLWVDIRQPGDYYGACSEFCGAEHAWMRIHVIAQSPADFNRWLDSNATVAAAPADSMAREGAILFQTKTCSNCHRIAGTAAIATAGPDLTHIGGRTEILTGMLAMNEKNLADWISHPQRIKEGSYMPDFMFSKDSIRAIAHYLDQLK